MCEINSEVKQKANQWKNELHKKCKNVLFFKLGQSRKVTKFAVKTWQFAVSSLASFFFMQV